MFPVQTGGGKTVVVSLNHISGDDTSHSMGETSGLIIENMKRFVPETLVSSIDTGSLSLHNKIRFSV